MSLQKRLHRAVNAASRKAKASKPKHRKRDIREIDPARATKAEIADPVAGQWHRAITKVVEFLERLTVTPATHGAGWKDAMRRYYTSRFRYLITLVPPSEVPYARACEDRVRTHLST